MIVGAICLVSSWKVTCDWSMYGVCINWVCVFDIVSVHSLQKISVRLFIIQFTCCGWNDPGDWNSTNYYNLTMMFPDSCVCPEVGDNCEERTDTTQLVYSRVSFESSMGYCRVRISLLVHVYVFSSVSLIPTLSLSLSLSLSLTLTYTYIHTHTHTHTHTHAHTLITMTLTYCLCLSRCRVAKWVLFGSFKAIWLLLVALELPLASSRWELPYIGF